MTKMTKIICAAALATSVTGAAFAETATKAPVNETPTQGLLGAGGIAASGTAVVVGLAVAAAIASQDNKPVSTTN